jgi:hypothetical protein
MTIIRNILEKKGIEPIEAGEITEPAQNVFCKKICSKIITSQFCIIFLNNDVNGKIQIPNANVNMEYGLMLGFNKYIVPLQRHDQNLPFNVAGLDTIKYTDQDLESKATDAIEKAIAATEQQDSPIEDSNRLVEYYLMSKSMLFTYVDTEGDQQIFRLGEPLKFNLINDFTGLKYAFLGQFSYLSPELTVGRIFKLNEMLSVRESSIDKRVSLGTADQTQAEQLKYLFEHLQIWVTVTSEKDKEIVLNEIQKKPINYPLEVISIEKIREEFGQ